MIAPAPLETTALGRRYGRRWALRDCSLRLPRGKVAALVGPNGAGKTTLLHLAVGLLRPTAGSVRVFGGSPEEVSILARVGFVAQDVPLYDGFTVEEMLTLGRKLNERWDHDLAHSRIERTGIPYHQKVGSLSGGQRAQVGLAMALAKRPALLVLDEPLASLDPLARREFLQALMEGVAEDGTTVLLSSHLVIDLERICDYLIVLQASRVQVVGDTENLLMTHRTLVGPQRDPHAVAGVSDVIHSTHTDRQTTAVVRTKGPILDPGWRVQQVTLEELVLAYLSQPSATALTGPVSEASYMAEVKA